MDDSRNDGRPSRRACLWRCVVGALLFAAAFRYASEGINWSRTFHPDEPTIARWMRQNNVAGYVTERAYPGGWFVLVNAWGHASSAWDKAARHCLGGTPRPQTTGARLGRQLNLVLFSLAVLLLYLAALETGVHPAAAAFGALLLMVHPLSLEHAHYCETDIAVPFSLCLSGWLALRAIRLQSRGWYLPAMFATGFAIACKYTLLPAVLWPLAVAPLVVRGENRRRRRAMVLAAVGVGALVAGFLFGTPALWRDYGFFTRSLRHVSQWTYAEGFRALGDAFGSTRARCLWRAQTLVREVARMGVVPLVFFGAALVVWTRRGRRNTLAVFPLLLLAFVPFAVFLLPWVRNQETLPLLTALCVGAAVAVDWAARELARRASSTRCRVAASTLLVLAAAALACTFCDGRRILTCFSRQDTRKMCHGWLRSCAADDVRLAYDRYTRRALNQEPFQGFFLPGTDQQWPDVLFLPDFQTNHIRYVLRNASYSGRRVNDLDAQKRTQAFLRDCLLLRSWKIAPGRMRTTTFVQPDVELWAMPDPDLSAGEVLQLKGLGPNIPAVLDRPVNFPADATPFYADGERSPVGPVRAMRVGHERQDFHPVPAGNSWVVTRVLAGPATGTISWDGLATPRRLPLHGHGVALFTVEDETLRRSEFFDVLPGARLRLVDADDRSSLCAAWPVMDRAEAARVLRRGGDAAGALALLREAPDLDEAAQEEAFLAAAAVAETPEPAWESAARNILRDIRQLAPNDIPADAEFRIRGVPLRVARDFANLRQSNIVPGHDGAFPVLLPPGTYRVTFIVPLESAEPGSGLWLEGQTGPAVPHVDGKGYTWEEATVFLPRESILRVHPDAMPEIGNDEKGFRELWLSWDPAEQLLQLADELDAAFSARESHAHLSDKSVSTASLDHPDVHPAAAHPAREEHQGDEDDVDELVDPGAEDAQVQDV